MGRGRFLEAAGMGIAAVTLSGGAGGEALASGSGGPPRAADTPSAALELLKRGNARFVADKSTCGSVSIRRLELAAGQSPFAIVLGCSDSRVPIETVFDQIPGNIFVVRVAGNFVADDGLGSIEYGVAALKAPLIVVLGHASCGAVEAAVGYVRDGTTQPGHIMDVVRAIEPAVKQSRKEPGDWMHNAIARNVRDNMAAIEQRSPIVADAVRQGHVAIAGGVYDLRTGKVNFS
jgi:carbonic anhydrase